MRRKGIRRDQSNLSRSGRLTVRSPIAVEGFGELHHHHLRIATYPTPTDDDQSWKVREHDYRTALDTDTGVFLLAINDSNPRLRHGAPARRWTPRYVRAPPDLCRPLHTRRRRRGPRQRDRRCVVQRRRSRTGAPVHHRARDRRDGIAEAPDPSRPCSGKFDLDEDRLNAPVESAQTDLVIGPMVDNWVTEHESG
jgi:hypothetical protein